MKVRQLTRDEIAKIDAIASVDAVAGTSTGPFMNRQLEVIDPRVMQVIEREMPFAMDVPVNMGIVHPGASSYTWRLMDKIGSTRQIAGSGKDLPNVEISTEEFTETVEQYGAQIEYTTREFDAAMLAKMNLDTYKADACRRAFIETQNRLCYFGNPRTGKTGLLNDSLVTKTVAANGGTGSPLWSSKTTAEKYADIQAMAIRIATASQGKIKPDVCLMPVDHYMQAVTQSFNPDGTNVTIAEQVKKALGIELRPRPECLKTYTTVLDDGTTTLTGGVLVSGTQYNAFVMYERSPQYVEFLVAKDITRMQLQTQGLSIILPYEMRLVGTVLRAPVAFDIEYGM